jgi:TolB-like protein
MRWPPLASLRALGEHGLKDLGRREVVYQLCHRDLPSAFPPLRTESAPREQPSPSIAVLPFVNMSRDEENEYFADGLTEELLNVLSRIRALRVASRTSAFHFKGKDADLATVAQKLNVATILEGSVRKSGKRVRITVQLIEVASDAHLWSQTYDRELDDIFAMQDDIAQSVVKELRAALPGERIDAATSAKVEAEVESATRGRAENPEAHRLYLVGRFHVDRQTREGSEQGVALMRQALDLDPGFARGWAGAERDFRCALSLAPENPDVLRARSNLAAELGRLDEAVALARRAATLDPLSIVARGQHGRLCAMAGRFDEAADVLRAAIELNPQAGLIHANRSWTLLMQGKPEEALAEAQRELEPFYREWAVALAQHALGRTDASEEALRTIIAEGAHDAAYQVAQVYAYRAEIDRAFEWLERAYAQRDTGLANVLADPLLNSLHGETRWQPFLRKIGLATSE